MKQHSFYVFDEHTDFVKECVKIGMKPLNGGPYVEKFDFNGLIYQALSVNECYSGSEVTVMALPRMNYYQLFCINKVKAFQPKRIEMLIISLFLL